MNVYILEWLLVKENNENMLKLHTMYKLLLNMK